MVRFHKKRSARATRAAGVTALVLLSLLSLAGLYVVVQQGSPTSQTGQTSQSSVPLGSGYGSSSNGSRGTYLTPVGTTTFAWNTPSDTSLVYGPVLKLSAVLNLSLSQERRIQAIQQQTQQRQGQEQEDAKKRMDTLFGEIKLTQQSKAGFLLPFSDPFSQRMNGVIAQVMEPVTLSQRERGMRSLFGQLAGVGVKTSKRLTQIEQIGSDEVENVLDESQQAALPHLLADMSVFRRLSFLPPERYVTLDLSEDQRYRLAVLAQRVTNEQRRGEQALTGPDPLRLSQPQTRSLPQMRMGDYMRLLQETREAQDQVKQKARREALSVLTPAQRRALAEPLNQPRKTQPLQ
ncbi:MAG: hypothetical protein V4671_33585 [Armatimonadota bacterium]